MTRVLVVITWPVFLVLDVLLVICERGAWHELRADTYDCLGKAWRRQH